MGNSGVENVAVLVAREEILVVDGVPNVVRRVLRYRVGDDRFTECRLYEEDQALIDRSWS